MFNRRKHISRDMMHPMANIIAILGCTASGKSALAEAVARQMQRRGNGKVAIMAVDSMQVYRRMDIGTFKPPLSIRNEIPHEMLDLAEPWESYSAARFREEALAVLERCQAHGRPVILVVGTVLYFKALTEGLFSGPAANAEIRKELSDIADSMGSAVLHERLSAVDPAAAARIHTNDRRRLIRALEVYQLTGTPISQMQTQWASEKSGIDYPLVLIERAREEISRRINHRAGEMMAQGLLEEVRTLALYPRGLSMQAAQAVGYREMLDYLNGRCKLEDAVEAVKINTRHLAKLQRTWIKRFQISLSVTPEDEEELDVAAAAIIERTKFDSGGVSGPQVDGPAAARRP